MTIDVIGNKCVIRDDATGVVVNSAEFRTDEELQAFIHRTETEFRLWCYKHGVRVCDFDYQAMLRYEYYMAHSNEYKTVQQAALDRAAMLEDERRMALEDKRQRKLLEERKAEAERQRKEEELRILAIEEGRRKVAEAQRLMLEREQRERDAVKSYLGRFPSLAKFCAMVHDDRDNGLISVEEEHITIRDHLRFYDSDSLGLSDFTLANIICYLFERGLFVA